MSTCAAAAARSSGSNWRGGGVVWRRSSAQVGNARSTCSATVVLASSIISSTIWLASRTWPGAGGSGLGFDKAGAESHGHAELP